MDTDCIGVLFIEKGFDLSLYVSWGRYLVIQSPSHTWKNFFFLSGRYKMLSFFHSSFAEERSLMELQMLIEKNTEMLHRA